MRSSEKLRIKREVAKRMIHKNMDSDYIKEITALSKKQVLHLRQINDSFIGDNDMYLRKKYACRHHLIHEYYLKNKTRFYTGTDIDKSDFYLNRFIQKSNDWKIKELIDEMPKYYANTLRVNSLSTIVKHLKIDKKYLNLLELPYECKYDDLDKYDVYKYITHKIKDYEREKNVLEILSLEGNLKRIAFITNLSDDFIENVVRKNSMFFSNGKLDLKRIENKREIWETELINEIARRTTDSWSAIEKNMKLLGLKREKLERYYHEYDTREGDEYEMRKEIAEMLMADSHSIQDISEISGIHEFHVELLADNDYYFGFFIKYYDKYADEKLIKYETV